MYGKMQVYYRSMWKIKWKQRDGWKWGPQGVVRDCGNFIRKEKRCFCSYKEEKKKKNGRKNETWLKQIHYCCWAVVFVGTATNELPFGTVKLLPGII